MTECYPDTDIAPRQPPDASATAVIVKPYGGTVAPKMTKPSKSLTPEQNKAVRDVVRRIVDEQFGKNVKAASEAMKIGYATLNELYRGIAGAGNNTITKLADYTGMSTDQVLGREARPSRQMDQSNRPTLGNARGWVAAEVKFRLRKPDEFPEEAYELARGVAMSSAPDPITEEFLEEIVRVVWKHHRDPSIAARQRAEHEAEEARLIAEHEASSKKRGA